MAIVILFSFIFALIVARGVGHPPSLGQNILKKVIRPPSLNSYGGQIRGLLKLGKPEEKGVFAHEKGTRFHEKGRKGCGREGGLHKETKSTKSESKRGFREETEWTEMDKDSWMDFRLTGGRCGRKKGTRGLMEFNELCDLKAVLL